MKKICVALLTCGLIPAANAQWAVTNVNDSIYYPAYFGPQGIFTLSLGQMLNAVKGSVDSVRSTEQAAAQQRELHLQDADMRNRVAIGQADIARRDFEQMPTLAQCVELTSRGMASGATRSALGATGGGSQDRTYRVTQITNTSRALGAVLSEKNTLGTCLPEMAGAAGCTAAPGRFAGGDMIPSGIKANIDSNGKSAAADIKNFSMNAEAWKVAQKYANDSSFYDAPRVATQEQLSKNQAYLAVYTALRSKLEAAHTTFIDIARIRREGDVDPSSVAGKTWADARTEYSQIFPALSYPEKPSLYELLNFNVFRDYMGMQQQEVTDDLVLQQQINKRLALANFIAWRNYQQQENTNILLGHILVQLTTPIKKDVVDNEHAKTMNLR